MNLKGYFRAGIAACLAVSVIGLPALGQGDSFPRGEWQSAATVDPLTDFENQTALNFSIVDDVIIGATCLNNETRFSLALNKAMGEPRNTRKRVMFRFDKEPVQERIMIVGGAVDIMLMDDNRQSIPLLKQMAGHETLIIRVTPDRGRTITATFNIAGFGEHMDKIRGACGW